MKKSRLIGFGGYLPEKVITNADLEKIVETSDSWIRARTGITQRHVVADGETTLDLAEKASRIAITSCGLSVSEIDLILVTTSTGNKVFPSTASMLQSRLGIKNSCGTMDIQSACSGFIYGLSVADQYIRAGTATTILVVGSETFSRILDWEDRNTCILFGDGAGAVVIRADDTRGILSTSIKSDGQYEELLHVPIGISQTKNNPSKSDISVHMLGAEVFKMAVKKLGSIVDETLMQNNLDKSAIDWLVPHQANLRIIMATAKKLDLPMDKVITTIDKHANTSAASIPLALASAVNDNKFKNGEILLLEAFGAGFTWGSALVEF